MMGLSLFSLLGVMCALPVMAPVVLYIFCNYQSIVGWVLWKVRLRKRVTWFANQVLNNLEVNCGPVFTTEPPPSPRLEVLLPKLQEPEMPVPTAAPERPEKPVREDFDDLAAYRQARAQYRAELRRYEVYQAALSEYNAAMAEYEAQIGDLMYESEDIEAQELPAAPVMNWPVKPVRADFEDQDSYRAARILYSVDMAARNGYAIQMRRYEAAFAKYHSTVCAAFAMNERMAQRWEAVWAEYQSALQRQLDNACRGGSRNRGPGFQEITERWPCMPVRSVVYVRKDSPLLAKLRLYQQAGYIGGLQVS